MLGGSCAFVSSRISFSTKKSFIIDALSASSVWTMSSLQSGGIDVVIFGLMKCLSVFHQSRGPVSAYLKFAANLSITDLYFSKSAGRVVFLYFCINVCAFL